MKPRIALAYNKILNVLRWTPLSRCLHISEDKLQVFNSFQEKTLDKNLQFIYLSIFFCSILVLLLCATIHPLWELRILHLEENRTIRLILLVFIGLNIIWNLAMFVVLKVHSFKIRVRSYFGVINTISSLLLHLMLSLFIGYSDASDLLKQVVCMCLFENSVVIFYFQNSFFVSSILWTIYIVTDISMIYWSAALNQFLFTSVVSLW